MELILERGDHPEVAAAAAQGPEQVGVLVPARVHKATVGEHDVGAEEVVDRQPVAAGQVAVTSAERQPSHPGGAHDPTDRGEPERVGRVVDIGPPAPWFYPNGLCVRVHPQPVQCR